MSWIHRAYDQISEDSIIKTFKYIGFNVNGVPRDLVMNQELIQELESVSNITDPTGFTEDTDVVEYREIYLKRLKTSDGKVVDYESESEDEEDPTEEDEHPTEDIDKESMYY